MPWQRRGAPPKRARSAIVAQCVDRQAPPKSLPRYILRSSRTRATCGSSSPGMSMSAATCRSARSRDNGGAEHARRPLSVSGALRGVPADGVGRDHGSAAGERFPQRALMLQDQQQTAKGDARHGDHAIDPQGPPAAQARPPAKTIGRLDHRAIRRDAARHAKAGSRGASTVQFAWILNDIPCKIASEA